MGVETKIQWCDHTFNPWRGCTKVAAGCTNCYADAQAKRNPGVLGIWGDDGTRVVASESMWQQPIKWDAAAAGDGVRRRVFCASLADVFEDWTGPVNNSKGERVLTTHYTSKWFTGASAGADRFLTINDVRQRLFRLIDKTPHLDWLLLTKRPENIRKMWPWGWGTSKTLDDAIASGYPNRLAFTGEEIPYKPAYRQNVWLVTSVANQADAGRNIPHLLNCRDLSPVLGVSAEPLVGPIDFSPWIDQLDWVIVGGESGPRARSCDLVWIHNILRQCRESNVSVFVKQIGSKARSWDACADGLGGVTGGGGNLPWPTEDPKGGDMNEWPEDLRVREWPMAREVAR